LLHFEEDKYFSELLLIKKSQYWSSIPIVLLMIVLIIVILNRQLKPHSMIVENILNYANNKINADGLKKNLVDINHTSDSDSAKISYALIQMLDVIEKNFKRIEQYNIELDQTNQKLEKSLKKIKKLSGLLPICSYCKKIRDDKGYWNQIEKYIHEHSEAEFSHGICHECAKKHYPDLGLYDD